MQDPSLTSRWFRSRVALQRYLARPPLAAVRRLSGALRLIVGGLRAAGVVHLQIQGQRTHSLHAGGRDLRPRDGPFRRRRLGGGDDVRRAALVQGLLEVLQQPHPGTGALQLYVFVLQLKHGTVNSQMSSEAVCTAQSDVQGVRMKLEFSF